MNDPSMTSIPSLSGGGAPTPVRTVESVVAVRVLPLRDADREFSYADWCQVQEDIGDAMADLWDYEHGDLT
jgi:hypothetical protein